MKKIIAFLLAAAMLTLCLGFTSCKGNNPDEGEGNTPVNPDNGGGQTTEEGIDYSVTLKDIFGNPISGISLKFTYDGNETDVVVSDENGVATKKINTYKKVSVEFVDLKGYGDLTKAQKNLNGDTEKTLVLPTVAVLTVVDADGNPVEGVSVQICHNVCIPPQPTNAEGVVRGSISSTERVKINIVSVPEGFVIPEQIGEYAGTAIHAYFPEGEYAYTLVLERA
ncbi:MAG: hypothetical protein IKL79_05990 [Clostridia bacterium]|nr:hypothetical protein [Clostridia bacterium]